MSLPFWDLDFSFQTFGAGSREDISSRIRIRGPAFLLLSSSAENVVNTKPRKAYVLIHFPLITDCLICSWGDLTVSAVYLSVCVSCSPQVHLTNPPC